MTYPALSIKQPWAWLIVNGYKDVENRKWATRYRGTLLIHAGRTFDDDFDWDWARDLLARRHHVVMPSDPAAYPLGGVVGRAQLVAIAGRDVPVEGWHRPFVNDSEWFFGPLGWALAEARATCFRPAKGALGLFIPEYKPAPAPALSQRRRRRR